MGSIIKGKIKDVLLTPERVIPHPEGNIFHGMKKSGNGFKGFGEAYFSTIRKDAIKAWKKHKDMTLNLLVPSGEVKFVLYDDRKKSETYGHFQEVVLSRNNYYRLTIPPQVWMGFKGLSGSEMNILLNIANIEHDPKESIRAEIEQFSYKW